MPALCLALRWRWRAASWRIWSTSPTQRLCLVSPPPTAMLPAVDRQLLWRELWLGASGAAEWWKRQRRFAASAAAMSVVSACCAGFTPAAAAAKPVLQRCRALYKGWVESEVPGKGNARIPAHCLGTEAWKKQLHHTCTLVGSVQRDTTATKTVHACQSKQHLQWVRWRLQNWPTSRASQFSLAPKAAPPLSSGPHCVRLGGRQSQAQ